MIWKLLIGATAFGVGVYVGVQLTKAEVERRVDAAGASALGWLFGENSRWTQPTVTAFNNLVHSEFN